MLCCVHFATKALCNIYRNISSSFSRQILSQTLTTNILPIFPKNKLPQEFRQILNPLLCCIGSTANWGLSKLFNSINKAFNTGFQLQQVNCEQNDIYNKKELLQKLFLLLNYFAQVQSQHWMSCNIIDCRIISCHSIISYHTFLLSRLNTGISKGWKNKKVKCC